MRPTSCTWCGITIRVFTVALTVFALESIGATGCRLACSMLT